MSEALVKAGSTALMQVPESDDDGMENVGNVSRLPQLKVCQNNQPEKDADSKYYVPDLKDGQFFLTRLRLVLGTDPIKFVVAYMDKYAAQKEYDAEGNRTGKTIGRLPFDHPTAKFGRNGEKPTADNTYDFYVILADLGIPAVLRMAITKIGAAEELEAWIDKTKGLSLGTYRLSIAKDVNSKQQKFFNFRVGFTGKVTPELYTQAKMLYAKINEGQVAVDEQEEGGSTTKDGVEVPF